MQLITLFFGRNSGTLHSAEYFSPFVNGCGFLQCGSGANSSQMLVFGGMTESSEISDELWSFSDGQWTQLANPVCRHIVSVLGVGRLVLRLAITLTIHIHV